MTFLALCIATAMFIAVANCENNVNFDDGDWKTFKQLFSRNYSREEETIRYKIFAENHRYMRNHTEVFGTNRYLDYPTDEYALMVNSVKSIQPKHKDIGLSYDKFKVEKNIHGRYNHRTQYVFDSHYKLDLVNDQMDFGLTVPFALVSRFNANPRLV